MSRARSYCHSFRLAVEPERAFSLFADPRHLDELTPPWFRLRPRTDLPRELGVGTEISYRLRWRGLPLVWTSRLTDWQPPRFFAYEQVRGPYRTFRHEHHFSAIVGGTEIVDQVLFRGPVGSLADRLITVPDLRRIFAFRQQRAPMLMRMLESTYERSGEAIASR